MEPNLTVGTIFLSLIFDPRNGLGYRPKRIFIMYIESQLKSIGTTGRFVSMVLLILVIA